MSSGSADYWITKDNWMHALLTVLRDALMDGGTIQTAIDSMDGKLDGLVDLSSLTDVDTGVLARVLGINTDQIDQATLITKLDNLDGVADGVLDLSGLNASLVTGGASTALKALNDSVDQMTLAVEKLIVVQTNTGEQLFVDHWAVDTSQDKILDLTSTNGVCTFILMSAHPSNTANITFYLKRDGNTLWTIVINPGGRSTVWKNVDVDKWNEIFVVAAADTQHYKVEGDFLDRTPF